MPMEVHVLELKQGIDPWYTAQALAHLPHLLFLDSSDHHSLTRGRYSYVMADPVEFVIGDHWDLLDNLKQSIQTNERNKHKDLPPFQGGFAGLLGYGLNRSIEKIPVNRINDLPTSQLVMGRYDWVIAFDHHLQKAWLLSRGVRNKTVEQIKQWIATESQPIEFQAKPRKQISTAQSVVWPDRFPDVCSNFSKENYIQAIRKAVEYVHAGDVFQVNISQRLVTPLQKHPLQVYGQLRQRCPAPYACYFDTGEFQILSASPEQFIQLDCQGNVRTRPIKGTRPRGKNPEEDQQLLNDLKTNPKDRAENVMIVDLLRNDIGKVCDYGSVHVTKVCEIESYNYVHHLVSEVQGKLAANRNAFDLLKASFPGGSVTGAPKVRSMEIIAELEPTARGPYCGSMVFIGYDGCMDSNILIRTMTAAHGWLQFPVGGGIVADSTPENEYEETLHKAQGLLKSLAK